MQTTAVTDNLLRLTRLHFVNAYLVREDDGFTLVDTTLGRHGAADILRAAENASGTIRRIALTHGHNDHVNVANELREHTGARVHLHPLGRVVWALTQDGAPDATLTDGQEFHVGDVTVRVLHTPGHSPGGCSFHVPALHAVFTGDTLFQGGPGATGRSFSDFPTIIDSIRTRLLTLPADTIARTGHGDSTTIGDEAPHLEEWIARGH